MIEECLQADPTIWEIGPYHQMLPGLMRLRLELDGEIVVSGKSQTGFMHRGIEKVFEKLSWQGTISCADHLDAESAAFSELALCMAVEEIGRISVPPRAQFIRIILCEIARVSSHLGYLGRMATATSSETMFHFVTRDRERLLDLFELLTGARFSLNFLRFGGVSADVTEGFLERVLDVCELIRLRLKEYNDVLSFNHAFLKRTAWIAPMGPELVRRLGITGPNARAAGVMLDVRKAHPYSGYENMDFEVPSGGAQRGTPGDSHHRYILRLFEIAQSLEILKHAVEAIPLGEYSGVKMGQDFSLPAGEAYSRVESSRGLLGCHVVSEGGTGPCRIQFRVPSSANIYAIPHLIRGARLEDVPVILASLDISVAEADR